MLPRALKLVFVALTGGALALVVSGCSSHALREWQPSDHDEPSENQGAMGEPMPAPSSSADARSLVEMTWQRQCSLCHGLEGRGNGPNAPMTHPPDLTDPKLQASASDEDLAQLIRKGRNRMPGFNLPQPLIQALVERIRIFGRKPQ